MTSKHETYSKFILPLHTSIGRFYLEKTTCSLKDAIEGFYHSQVPLDKLTLIADILRGLSFLHSHSQPISHGNLCVEALSLKLDPSQQRWILKIGDFSQAQVEENPTETESDVAPLVTLSLVSASPWMMIREDLKAAARIVFYITMAIEKHDFILMQDLIHLSDVQCCAFVNL